MYSQIKTIVNGIMTELLFEQQLAYKDFYFIHGKYQYVFHVGGIYVGRESMSGSLMVKNKCEDSRHIYSTMAYVTHRPIYDVSRKGVLSTMVGIIRDLASKPIRGSNVKP